MYLYFYPPDSQEIVGDSQKLAQNASRFSILNLSLAAELNFNSKNCSCASSKMLPISHCNMFLASHL